MIPSEGSSATGTRLVATLARGDTRSSAPLHTAMGSNTRMMGMGGGYVEPESGGHVLGGRSTIASVTCTIPSDAARRTATTSCAVSQRRRAASMTSATAGTWSMARRVIGYGAHVVATRRSSCCVVSTSYMRPSVERRQSASVELITFRALQTRLRRSWISLRTTNSNSDGCIRAHSPPFKASIRGLTLLQVTRFACIGKAHRHRYARI
jgi:hypothetical protein